MRLNKDDLIICRGHVCRVMELKSSVPNMVTHVRVAQIVKDPRMGMMWTAKISECRPLTKLERALQ